jgi:hypothetical protein
MIHSFDNEAAGAAFTVAPRFGTGLAAPAVIAAAMKSRGNF